MSVRRVARVYSAELSKVLRTRFPYLGLVASALMSLIARQSVESPFQQGTATAAGYFTDSVNMAATLTIPLFATIFSSMVVATEAARGTFRTTLVRPVTRGEFLTGKLLMALTYLVLLFAANVIPGFLLALKYPLAAGGSEYVEIPSAGRQILIYAAALGITFLPLAATVCFGFCISALSSNPATAIGVAVGLLLSIEPLKHLGNLGLEPWVVSSYYDTAMGIASDLAAGIYPSYSKLPWLAGVSAGTAAVFLGIGYWSFLRRDLTA